MKVDADGQCIQDDAELEEKTIMGESGSDKPRVLHVDDDDDIRTIAKIALELVGGLEVLQCSGGQQALAEAANFAPDLFLLDFMMPELTGEETLALLRLMPNMEAVPVIFMTAKAQPEDIAHLMSLGSLKVISKPFDPLTLAADIVDVWQKSRSGQALG